jgi:hypothetical protein
MAATTRTLPSRSTAAAAAAAAAAKAVLSGSAVVLLALVVLSAPRPTLAQDGAVATTGNVVINEIMYNENTSKKKGAAGETEVRPEAHIARRVPLVLYAFWPRKAGVINRFCMGVLESTRDCCVGRYGSPRHRMTLN